MHVQTTSQPYRTSQIIGMFCGIFLFAGLLALPAPDAIGQTGWHVVALAALMLSWWVSEAVPIPVTALTPVILLPALDVMPIKEVTASYGHPIVFLFMGGFIIALALEKWKLHLRIALYIVRFTGTRATGIVAGFMVATAFLSMWVSNTATTVMMLPIALSVLQLLEAQNKQGNRFAIALLLGVAFAANIGGTATIIGTPPNAIFAGFMSNRYGYQVDFLTWIMVGGPFMLVMLFLSWLFLTRLFKLPQMGHIEGSSHVIETQWQSLGKITHQEKIVAVIFVTTAALWIGKSLLPFSVSDTSIAVFGALSFFFVPVDLKKGQFLLAWEDTKALPWGILLLFGGGLNLAAAMSKSGLVELIGQNIAFFYDYGFLALVLAVIIVVIMLTECMSNLALITVMLPVIALLSLQFDVNPLILTVGATLASSCAFMLPMATPPNAIVFSSGHMRVENMIKAGIWLNLLASAVITLFIYTLIPSVFDVPLEMFTQ